MAAAVVGTGTAAAAAVAAAAPAPAASAVEVMPPYCSLPSSGRRVSFLSQPRVSDAICGGDIQITHVRRINNIQIHYVKFKSPIRKGGIIEMLYKLTHQVNEQLLNPIFKVIFLQGVQKFVPILTPLFSLAWVLTSGSYSTC